MRATCRTSAKVLAVGLAVSLALVVVAQLLTVASLLVVVYLLRYRCSSFFRRSSACQPSERQ